jgi:hypothetical protein
MRKPEAKRPLGIPRHMWVDNIKMGLRDIQWSGMDWIDVAHDRDQCRALVNTVVELWVKKNRGRSWVTAQLAASREGLSSMKLVIHKNG